MTGVSIAKRTAALLGAIAALAAASSAAPSAEGASTKGLLWATVNACDTPARPDRMGVRGSMPGTGRAGKMLIRFSAQYYDAANLRWRSVHGSRGTSPWLLAGSSKLKFREVGWTFEFDPPAPGAAFRVRGAADFEWRERRPVKKGSKKTKSVVVKRRRAITTAGHVSKTEGDPPGFTADACEIRG